METGGTTLHNYWHSLAEAEMSPADLMNEGVNIQSLEKGDIIKFETARGSDGFATRVTLEVTYPKPGGIKIVETEKFIGNFRLEISKDVYGRGVRGVFVARGDKHDGKPSKLGWIGIGVDIHLDNGTVFRSVRNISVNGSLLIFPPSSDTIQ